ncbi:hypothetical protein CLOAM1111 [Candidatus Cloacimonas acidaminovorans str. Evry]|uniref:Uncharacterized protein n=1 Tax=Cloacimonas acidaminovorans (strain Evry) TaxID=459349 RepID=B0VI02_CLOAI|nr:hypothetical protein CLOAM1111 [Candidatus Cloacimonas acidaminovorans str. Evry]
MQKISPNYGLEIVIRYIYKWDAEFRFGINRKHNIFEYK